MSGESRQAGEPIKVPVIDLAEVGAGGGSIAWVDLGGFLQVGPHSAGADPGPACYGFGGTEPTVTNADVVLGYLDPGYFLGGRMKIYPEKGREAIKSKVADKLGIDVVAAAKGVYDLVNARMGSAIRVVTVRRGVDPRELTAVAFGGAGPVHILKVAEQFDIPTVIVPLSPGVRSAFGLLVADRAYEYITTRLLDCKKAKVKEVAGIIEAMESEARDGLRREGMRDEDIVLQRFVDVRFIHQRQEVAAPVPPGPVTQATIEAAENAFRQAYADFLKLRPTDPCQFVNFRVRAVGLVAKPSVRQEPVGDGDLARATKGSRQAYFQEAGGFVETPVYDRIRLRNGDWIAGPAVVEEPDSTTICPPRYEIKVDRFLNLSVGKPAIP